MIDPPPQSLKVCCKPQTYSDLGVGLYIYIIHHIIHYTHYKISSPLFHKQIAWEVERTVQAGRSYSRKLHKSPTEYDQPKPTSGGR